MGPTDSSQQTVWFQDESSTSPELDRIKRTHRTFRDGLRGIARINETELTSTRQGLLEQVNGDSLPRRLSVIQHFRKLSALHNEHVRKRQHGARKAGNWAQEHTRIFADFVEKYSKLIETVFSAAGPYGTIGLLGLPLKIIVNKVRNDTKIIDLLDELRKSLPRLEAWDSIYPTDNMKKLVATVYVQITEFCRQAVAYLAKTGKRVLLAVAPVLGSTLDNITTEIHRTLAEINSEAMYGLHQRSKETEKKIEDLIHRAQKAETGQQTLLALNKELLRRNAEADKVRETLRLQNEGLEKQLERQHRMLETREREEDERQVRRFEDELGIDVETTQSGANIATTKDALRRIFPDMARSPHVAYSSYQQMSRFLLISECPQYQQWTDAESSSLLFISGSTATEGRRLTGYPHCWLSPVAIYAAEDIQQRPGTRLAFFSCLPDMYSGHPNVCTALCSIILQIIGWKPEILRGNFDHFRRRLLRAPTRDSSARGNGGSKWTTESLLSLLGHVIAILNRGSESEDKAGEDASGIPQKNLTYIILDRLDHCDQDKAAWDMMDGLARIITSLNRRAEEGSVRVKILAIVETSGLQGEWRKDWLSRREYDLNRLLTCQNWNQMKLTTQQMSMRDRPQIWSL